MAENRAQLTVREPTRSPHDVEDRHAVGDVFMLLGVVARCRLVAGLDGSKVGLLDAGKDLQESRLAGTVEAHDDQPLCTVDVDVNVDEHNVVAVRLGESLRTQRSASGWNGLGEPERNLPPNTLYVDEIILHPANPCLPCTRATGHRFGRPLESSDPFLEPCDLRLLLTPLAKPLGSPLLMLFEVVRVVASKWLNATTFGRQHRCDRPVK